MIWLKVVTSIRYNNPSSNIFEILLIFVSFVQICQTIYALQVQMGEIGLLYKESVKLALNVLYGSFLKNWPILICSM